MGGKALKNVDTVRLNKADYGEICSKVQTTLGSVLWIGAVVPAYRNKADFGDADILVMPVDGVDLRKEVESRFQPKQIVVNGGIISFDYKDFQVDLIRTNQEDFKFSLGYFAYNDLGNFIGRTAHRLGFKFGHDGLWYSYRDPENEDRMFREILITKNFDAALWFLGFDPNAHRKGFDDPEDIFAYAASSEFFEPAQFLLHNRSYAARKRDSTRKMYEGMLRWILKNFPDLPADAKPAKLNKNLYLARAMQSFPDFEQRFRQAEKDLADLKAFKAVFNGDLYREWYGLEGKDLGTLMERHRKYIEQHNLRDWISTLTTEQYKELANFIEKVA